MNSTAKTGYVRIVLLLAIAIAAMSVFADVALAGIRNGG